jgi:putative ABC transport system ATP-binding protein
MQKKFKKMIQLKHISKHYPVGFGKNEILKDIDLTIFEGEFVSIMGPSGSGKSTLLHILGLLEEPSQGEYLFDGESVLRMNEKKRTQLHRGSIGFVFQAYHLIDELNVYENIETPLLYSNVSASERKSRVADILDRFNIVGKKDLFPNQLSGGQQQLVGIARAIVAQPRVILADEPTGNLHSDQAKEIMELFKQLNEKEKITIIQVTHSEQNATYGNRIIQIRDGKIA